MKRMKKEFWLTVLVCLLPLFAGAYFYPQLPEQVATHFGIDGTPNGYSSRFAAVLGMPAGVLALHLVCCFGGTRGKKFAEENARMQRLTLWICPFVSVLMSAMTLGTALGNEMSVEMVVPAAVGLMFLALGNYMPKIRPNHTLGVRTPWTYASEENWRYTHRVAGFAWVVAGFLMLLASLLGAWRGWLTVAFLVLVAGVPIAASYLYYRRHGEGKNHE